MHISVQDVKFSQSIQQLFVYHINVRNQHTAHFSWMHELVLTKYRVLSALNLGFTKKNFGCSLLSITYNHIFYYRMLLGHLHALA